jgi:hypothetical protein
MLDLIHGDDEVALRALVSTSAAEVAVNALTSEARRWDISEQAQEGTAVIDTLELTIARGHGRPCPPQAYATVKR